VSEPALLSRTLRPARLAAITLWLLAGHALVAGAIWGFLLIPESNVGMLLLSAITATFIVGVTGIVENAALLGWTGVYVSGTAGWRQRIGDAWRRLPAFLAGLAIFGALWWITGRLDGWWAIHRGEIDAWLLVTFAITDASALHAAVRWFAWAVRYVVGLSLALALIRRGTGALPRPEWLVEAVRPRRLAAIAICLLALVVVPWRLAGWRPGGLPASWVEALFVTVKLATIVLAAHVGWALVLLSAAGIAPAPQSTSVQDVPA
jgi:hypothetical protein